MGLWKFLLEEEKWNGNENSGHKQRKRQSFHSETGSKIDIIHTLGLALSSDLEYGFLHTNF